MAGYNDVYAAKIVDMVGTAGITISCNAHINLVCSARLDREPRRRGIARVKELLARGVNVVTSQDDVNDPYYPFGKPDPLECVSMIAHVAQLTLPHELEQAMNMVTENAAKAARVDDYGIAAGSGPISWSSALHPCTSNSPAAAAASRVQARPRSCALGRQPRAHEELRRWFGSPPPSCNSRLRCRAQPLVRVDGVDKVFASRTRAALKAVDNVSLAISSGEFVSIVGRSGCGKSTLMMMISGLMPSTKGSLDRQDSVTRPYTESRHRVSARRPAGMADGSRQHPVAGRHPSARPPRIRARAKELLARAGLAASRATFRGNCPAACASAVSICRALVCSPAAAADG
jgi:hypothetical protein